MLLLQRKFNEYKNEYKADGQGIRPKVVIVDPSAAALKVELRQKGYRVQDANNDVINGIANTGKLLQDGKLLFSEECENTIDEFSLYMWDDAAAERGEDLPIKENDHAMDAMRYFVNTLNLYQKLYKKPAAGSIFYY